MEVRRLNFLELRYVQCYSKIWTPFRQYSYKLKNFCITIVLNLHLWIQFQELFKVVKR